jgi:uncharacterized membrane protein
MSLLLAIATALGAAAVGGIYLAFSLMVMPALARLTAAQATATMQEINRRAGQGVFIVVFLGSALLAVALALVEVFVLPSETAAFLLAGAALSFASAVVTVVGNVPLNNRLERDGVAFWPQYLPRWTALNTVRALLALAAVGVIVAAGAS